jgi:tetratricopeptide (TPR) repeat protein
MYALPHAVIRKLKIHAGLAILLSCSLPLPLLPASLYAQSSSHAIRTTAMSTGDHETLRKALDAYDQGNSQIAEPLLLDLTRRFPKNYESHEALGSLYAESGNYQRALPLLQQAVTLRPNQGIAHANLGAIFLKLKRNTEAVAQLQFAAKLDADNAGTQSNLGQALLLTNQPAAAAQAFAVAARLQPANTDFTYNRALALFDSNALPEAAAALRSIPAGDMTDQYHSLAGDVEEKQGKYKDALLHYQAAAQLNPSSANLYSLTLDLLRHWNWDEALKVANFGAARYPEETRLKVAAGIALYADNKYAESAAVFSGLLVHDPENEGYVDLLGRSCGALGVTASPDCDRLEDFAAKHPGNARAAVYAATNILHLPSAQQNSAKAEQLLKQAIAADPRLAEAYYELGVLAQQRLQWQESSLMLEKAIALRPAYSEAHYRLSRAYAHLGRHDEAQQQITLQQQYSQQEKDHLNSRMQEVVTFLLKTN